MKQAQSITRLLATRKVLEARITRATNESFVGVQKGSPANADVLRCPGKTVEVVKQQLTANLNKVTALINYHADITAALVASNAKTLVSIAGQEMTVACAIERKQSIKFTKTLLASVINQANKVENEIHVGNTALDDRIEKQMAVVLGADKSKVTPAIRAEIAGPMEVAGKLYVIDPNNIQDWARKTMDKISDFENQVDFVLSESNARTLIELDDGEPTPAPVATA